LKKRVSRRFLREERVVIDTSVFVEYIIENSPYHDLIDKILHGETGLKDLWTTPLVLSEVLYIVSRLYRIANIQDPNARAKEYVSWIASRCKMMSIEELAIKAGELKKELRISLSDCYVIAAAEKIGGRALFLKPEKEMIKVIDKIRNLNVIFLTEIISSV